MAYISNYLSMGIKPIYKIINENKLLEINQRESEYLANLEKW